MDNLTQKEEEEDLCSAPQTPPGRVQLKPKLAYSRSRFKEKKFSHLFIFSSVDDVTRRNVSRSPLGPGTADLAPPTTPLPTTHHHHPGHEKSGHKKKEENDDDSKFWSSSQTHVNIAELKKRKREGEELNKRPLKTPKKKIHRPRIVGEGKPRRPREPKTPKPTTPKRPYTKGKGKGKGKNKGSENADPTRRALNFDNTAVENQFLEDRTGVDRDLSLDLISPVVTRKKRSKCRAPPSKDQPSFVRSEGRECDDFQAGEEVEEEAKTDTLNENLSSDFKSIEFREETMNICNAMAPSLTDLSLPYVENETSFVEQSNGQLDNGAIIASQTIVAVDQKQICVVKKSRREVMLEHYKDEIKAWKVEVKRIGYGNADGEEDEEAKREKLERERATFSDRIEVFTSCMHIILGNRTFSKWKGSVIDSVIGVFLTQNVSDILSSSAFIDLRARFPIRSSNEENREGGFKLLDIEDVVRKTHTSLEDDLEEMCKKVDRLIIDDEHKRSGSGSASNSREANLGGKMKKEEKSDWEEVRKRYQRDGKITDEQRDSVDWEAVRHAPTGDIADTIKKRGQHNNIAKRIKEFLDRVVELHKTLDLEWLRDVPADQVQKYLLEFNGLGLKSVECIRLLGIQNVAFPVDTNVGRIAVRLGWVPLEPLPEELQIHLLQQFPIMDSIQKYLWPRLCTLDQLRLYELHYHLITFGKVFCTKRNPNCNECPMKADCRHYASHYASARKALPAAPSREKESSSPVEVVIHPLPPPPPPLTIDEYFEPTTQFQTKAYEPIIEMPQSPKPEPEQYIERDIEEYYVFEDGTERIPTIILDEEPRLSQAMVALTPEVTSFPVPKLKSISRLRTKHLVYELPDSHPILVRLDKRDPDDPSPYLLAIWTSDETTSSSNECGKDACDEETCRSCSGHREHNRNIVRGTILIPCRTAMRGSFPLNGTYFQVNEVFADHESSHNPVEIPTELLWNLRRRFTYFGTSTTTIFKGLTMEEIKTNFWRGFMCNRAYDRQLCTTRPLALRLHISTAQQAGKRKKND